MNKFLIYDLLRLTKLKYHWVPSTFKIIRDFVSEDKESDQFLISKDIPLIGTDYGVALLFQNEDIHTWKGQNYAISTMHIRLTIGILII